MYAAAVEFDLPLGGLHETGADDVTAIWNGEEFVYVTKESEGWWWDVGRMWWRYGMAPYKAVKLVREVVGTFLKLYEAPYFPFRSLTERVFELGLERITGVTGEQFLAERKVGEVSP